MPSRALAASRVWNLATRGSDRDYLRQPCESQSVRTGSSWTSRLTIFASCLRDQANFINFCAGLPLTNGQQLTGGSCNGIPMGRLPAKSNMISSIITHPQPGDRLPAKSTFNITIQTHHLRAGFLVNPSVSYYTAPQQLDENGDIIGHCHVTIQDIGSLKTGTPPDPTKFVFFKGVDDPGNGKGLLQAEVTGGLPAGFYRVCTMISARNHQPVTMPVAQRGAQDDCTKFEVISETSKI